MPDATVRPSATARPPATTGQPQPQPLGAQLDAFFAREAESERKRARLAWAFDVVDDAPVASDTWLWESVPVPGGAWRVGAGARAWGDGT